MYITRELFVVPDGEHYILFAPLKGALLKVDSNTVGYLQECSLTGLFPESAARDELMRTGILTEILEPEHMSRKPKTTFKPTSVTLFPTSDCNLRCTYCYAAAGETQHVLAWPVAKAAVDLVFTNAVALKKNRVAVGFHGGGEPFYGRAWPLVRSVTEYAHTLAKQHAVFLSLSAGTNGVLSIPQLEWITKNFGNLNISLDGPEDLQNTQRPLKSGAASLPYVLRTIRFLEERNFSYGIRATITQESVGRMKEMIDFYRSVTRLKQFHFEPLFECGRCKTTGAGAPDGEEFVRAMLEAIPYAKSHGINLYYSGASIDRTIDSFCGAAGRSFCVTPQGYVTSCFEVSLDSDPRSSKFFFGKYDADSESFSFDSSQLAHLRTRTVHNLPHCKDCFIKYQCAGDCLAKVDATGDMFATCDNTRCSINQQLSRFRLNERLTSHH